MQPYEPALCAELQAGAFWKEDEPGASTTPGSMVRWPSALIFNSYHNPTHTTGVHPSGSGFST